MELEIGMYVRTDEGIFRISHINIPFDDNDYRKVLLSHNKKFSFASVECIRNLKPEPSFNIIDLIEVGDMVNNKIVGYINDSDYYDDIFLSEDWEKPYETMIVKNQNYIKSIITREQIEQVSYKVVE